MIFQTGLGIDVGHDAVRIVYLKASLRGAHLEKHAVFPLQPGIPLEERLRAAGGLIREFVNNNNITSTGVFMAVPRDIAILRYIELPYAVRENLREALGYEMERYVPIASDDIYFDYQVIAENKEQQKLTILLVVIKKDVLDPYLALRGSLPGGLCGIELQPTAIVNYCVHKDSKLQKDSAVVLFCAGEDCEISLIREGRLNHSRFLRFQEEDQLSEDILQSLKTLREESEEGLPPVYMYGFEAFRDIAESLRTALNCNVRNMDAVQAELPSADLVPAYGLALRCLQKVPMKINLLPVGYRKKDSRTRYYVMFVLAALLILLSGSWLGGSILRQRIHLSSLNSEIGKLTRELADIKQIQKQIEELEKDIDFLNSLNEVYTPSLDIVKELSLTIPSTAWIRRLYLKDKKLQIEGYADSASDLISLLEASGLFRDVVFLSPITKTKEGKESFRIGLGIG